MLVFQQQKRVISSTRRISWQDSKGSQWLLILPHIEVRERGGGRVRGREGGRVRGERGREGGRRKSVSHSVSELVSVSIFYTCDVEKLPYDVICYVEFCLLCFIPRV